MQDATEECSEETGALTLHHRASFTVATVSMTTFLPSDLKWVNPLLNGVNPADHENQGFLVRVFRRRQAQEHTGKQGRKHLGATWKAA